MAEGAPTSFFSAPEASLKEGIRQHVVQCIVDRKTVSDLLQVGLDLCFGVGMIWFGGHVCAQSE